MKISRRSFLQAAGTAGFLLPSGFALFPHAAHAQAAPYAGKIFVNIYVNGGLDQSSWTDPRETDPTINTYAGTPAIVAGNLRVAPMGNNASFFQKYYRQMLVINGIYSDNNSHGFGAREQATGSDSPGLPNIVELFAYNHGTGLPMPWLADGGDTFYVGYSVGLRGATAFPNPTGLRTLVLPNEANSTTDFMKPANLDKVRAKRLQRLQAMQARGDLPPKVQDVINQFVTADGGRALLGRVPQFLPDTLDANFPQAHMGLIAAQAGITSGFQLSTTNAFDTHANHDATMATMLPRLTDLIDFLWQRSADLGLQDRIFMRIFTEFGRTPMAFNGGKEHYSGGGTMILMESNPAWGNRVVGATGPRHQRLQINPTTGAVDPVNGTTIKARHVLSALRKYLNLTVDPVFDLRVPASQNFDFFNPNMRTGYPTI